MRDKQTSRFCDGLLDLWAALWNFTDTPDVDPTDNRAELAPRPSGSPCCCADAAAASAPTTVTATSSYVGATWVSPRAIATRRRFHATNRLRTQGGLEAPSGLRPVSPSRRGLR